MFNHLKESASVFPIKYKRDYYLLSKNGFTDELKNIKDDSIHLIELKDMLSIT